MATAAKNRRRIFSGTLSGEGVRIGIVVSRFNQFITERLLQGAVEGLVRAGCDAAEQLEREAVAEE